MLWYPTALNLRASYTQTVAPDAANPLLTMEEAKFHARVGTGSDEDVFIQSLIDAATDWIQGYQWSQLISATWVMRMDRFPADTVIELHPNPVISITSVQYVDTGGTTQTLIDTTDYTTDIYAKPARIVPAFSKAWPATRCHINDVVVTFVSGYGTTAASVPTKTKQAAALLIAHWYRNREATGNVGPEIAFAVKALLDSNSFRVFY